MESSTCYQIKCIKDKSRVPWRPKANKNFKKWPWAGTWPFECVAFKEAADRSETKKKTTHSWYTILQLVYFYVQNLINVHLYLNGPKQLLQGQAGQGDPQECMLCKCVWESANLEEGDWCIQPIRPLNDSDPPPLFFLAVFLAVAVVHPHAGDPSEMLASGCRLKAPPPCFWGTVRGARLSRPQL